MEDNLNRATNQFARDNYTKYTRCVHIAWNGDVFAANYLEAEPNADEAGIKLVGLLQQLKKEGIAINVISHSLGNRVLLRAMAELAAKGETNVIDHAFLWDAAVPATALSSNERQQLMNKPSDQFLSAVEAAKKITVLYSKNDLVLRGAYYFAKYSGLTLYNIPQRYIETAKVNWSKDVSDDLTQRAHQALIDKHRCLGMLANSHPSPETQAQYHQVCQDMYQTMQHYDVQPTIAALGFDGLDSQLQDEQIKRLRRDNKIRLADMTPYSTGHDYMKIPSQAVMKYGYKTYIINQKQGIKSFGTYSPENFPNYSDPKDNETHHSTKKF